MALLGHVSAEMSLRYGRLFDSTVRSRIRARPDRRESTTSAPLPTEPPTGRTRCRSSTATGSTPPRSRPASPAASASAPRSKARAPTPTSASTAPTSAPTPATCPSWPLNAPTPKPSPATPKPAAGPAKPNATADSSNASTPTSVRHKPDDTPTAPPTRRRRLRRNSFSPASPSPSTTSPPAPDSGRATLYRNPDLRAIVEEHRTRGREAHTLTGPRHRDRPPPHRTGRRRRHRPPPRRRTPPPPQAPTLRHGNAQHAETGPRLAG